MRQILSWYSCGTSGKLFRFLRNWIGLGWRKLRCNWGLSLLLWFQKVIRFVYFVLKESSFQKRKPENERIEWFTGFPWEQCLWTSFVKNAFACSMLQNPAGQKTAFPNHRLAMRFVRLCIIFLNVITVKFYSVFQIDINQEKRSLYLPMCTLSTSTYCLSIHKWMPTCGTLLHKMPVWVFQRRYGGLQWLRSRFTISHGFSQYNDDFLWASETFAVSEELSCCLEKFYSRGPCARWCLHLWSWPELHAFSNCEYKPCTLFLFCKTNFWNIDKDFNNFHSLKPNVLLTFSAKLQISKILPTEFNVSSSSTSKSATAICKRRKPPGNTDNVDAHHALECPDYCGHWVPSVQSEFAETTFEIWSSQRRLQ